MLKKSASLSCSFGLFGLSGLSGLFDLSRLFGFSGSSNKTNQIDQTNQTDQITRKTGFVPHVQTVEAPPTQLRLCASRLSHRPLRSRLVTTLSSRISHPARRTARASSSFLQRAT